jgi:predicted nucleic acid-binding protein
VTLTVDASVWIASLYEIEQDHSQSVEFLEAVFASREALDSPTLLLVEVAAAASRKSQSTAFGLEVATKVESFPNQRWHSLDQQLAQAALSTAAHALLRGADAVYVTVAQSTGATLVTLDREMVARTLPGVNALTPEQWLAASHGSETR